MRNLFVLFLLIIGSNLYGQTDSIEKATLYNKMMSKEIMQEKYAEIGKLWNQSMNKYPDLPLDQSGQVHYTFVNNFKNINKEKLFRRVLEYLSINYGLYPANLYSNSEDGKIIFAGNFNINATYTGTFTTVISIKDEKMLTEFINIGYQVIIPGDEYTSESTRYYPISNYYPVILKNQREWTANLNLFIATNKYFKGENTRIGDFALNHDLYYTF